MNSLSGYIAVIARLRRSSPAEVTSVSNGGAGHKRAFGVPIHLECLFIGFGTLDELFELLTLLQTRKMRKHLPVVLFGKDYWQEVINFGALIRYGMIDPAAVKLFYVTDAVDDAFEHVTNYLSEYALAERGAIL